MVSAAAMFSFTAACGAGGSENGGSVQGVADKVITIGANSVLSGPASAYAAISTSSEHYFDYINSKGGVNGYTFKYIQRDNAYSGSQGVTVARQLALEEKVFAMIATGSTPNNAIIPMAAQLKLPIIALNDGGLFPEEAVPNLYGIEPKFSQVTAGNARYAMEELGHTRVAYAYEDNDFGQPGAKAVPEYVEANGGTMTANIGFPPGEANLNPYASKLKESGAEVVVFGGSTAGIAGIQKAAAAIGYKPAWVAMFSAATPAYLDLAGASAEGTYIDSFFDPIEGSNPEMQEFREVLKDYPDEIGLLGQLGWQSAAMIVRGVERATADDGELSWESFQDALNNLTGERVAVWPEVTWTEDSHTGSTSEFMMRVKDGKFVPVTEPAPLP